ncbi:MAG TPA: GNAT family N-acetyltransferase [Candidatus Limnocylindrales bacterium]|nr:GNAT family N-acetyltransferase [Candidatus Limnocylindrales bacterium]
MMPDPSSTVRLTADVEVRPAELADLAQLEWFGQYAHYRRLFRDTYHEQQQGLCLMLVADFNGFPIGQVFLQLQSNRPTPDDSLRMYYYALRVLDPFQRMGIGTALLDAAEGFALRRAYGWATIAAGKDNPAARRMYERRGYMVCGEEDGDWSYIDQHGRTRYVQEPCWALEKRLRLR